MTERKSRWVDRARLDLWLWATATAGIGSLIMAWYRPTWSYWSGPLAGGFIAFAALKDKRQTDHLLSQKEAAEHQKGELRKRVQAFIESRLRVAEGRHQPLTAEERRLAGEVWEEIKEHVQTSALKKGPFEWRTSVEVLLLGYELTGDVELLRSWISSAEFTKSFPAVELSREKARILFQDKGICTNWVWVLGQTKSWELLEMGMEEFPRLRLDCAANLHNSRRKRTLEIFDKVCQAERDSDFLEHALAFFLSREREMRGKLGALEAALHCLRNSDSENQLEIPGRVIRATAPSTNERTVALRKEIEAEIENRTESATEQELDLLKAKLRHLIF